MNFHECIILRWGYHPPHHPAAFCERLLFERRPVFVCMCVCMPIHSSHFAADLVATQATHVPALPMSQLVLVSQQTIKNISAVII